MPHKSTVWVFIALWALVQACTPPQEKQYTFENNILTIKPVNGAHYQVAALSKDIFKVSYQDSLTYGNKHYAAVLTTPVPVVFEDLGEQWRLSTDHASVVAKLSGDSVKFVFEDAQGGVKTNDISGFSRIGDTTRWQFSLSPDEAIYGTGARALPMNRRGYRFQHYNQANYGYEMGVDFLNYSIPVVASSKKYMLLFDNPARGYFDIGKANADQLEFGTLGGNMAYYFINGDSYPDLMKHYTALTGRQPLPPIWALGHLQSRFGYRNQTELEGIVAQTLAAGIPIDATIIDLYWFGEKLQNGNMGQLAWDSVHWPTPKAMIAGFKEQGIKTVLVSEPFFTKNSQHFDYLSKQGWLGKNSAGTTMSLPDFYFGDGGLLDIFNPDARKWLWGRYQALKADGVAGWWGDLGEPEVHPDSMIHATGSGRELHGFYGHEWVRTLYDGYTANYPKERLFKLGRAGFAGSQRYGLIPWSGDVNRSWGGLKAQLPVMLGMGISGLPYMHSDAGGFCLGPKDAALYTRWLQFAAFSPIFRPHSDVNTAPSEPVLWDKRTMQIAKKTIQMRYALLPYLYTMAWQTKTTGMPLARPMFMAFPEVSDTLDFQYLWGDALLVAPVLEPGLKSLPVYLPKGTWYDFWTHQPVAGGGYSEVALSEAHIPVFAQGGTILPISKPIANTSQYHSNELTLRCYLADGAAKGEVYFDDGHTKSAFEQGAYQLLNANFQPNQQQYLIDLKITGEGFANAPKERNIKFEIIGLEDTPSAVSDEEEIVFQWDDQRKILSFESTLRTDKNIKIMR